jgi:hypothetical protein
MKIKFDTTENRLIATVNDIGNVKVAYIPSVNQVNVIKDCSILKVESVEPNYPASEFMKYCLEIRRVFNG